MAAMQEYWFVATGVQRNGQEPDQASKDNLARTLQNSKPLNYRGQEVFPFKVPDGQNSMHFGSLDHLYKASDELHKADQQIDSIAHRYERQWLEIDPKAEFKMMRKIGGEQKQFTFEEYMKSFEWDEGKFSKSGTIQDILAKLVHTITTLDDRVRAETQKYNESKAAHANLSEKEGGNNTTRELVDVLTHDKVGDQLGTYRDALIYTQHITSVVLIVGKGGEKEFLKTYESMSEHVVPGSHFKFEKEGTTDKEGNSIWRVLVMREGVEEFKKKCRENRLVTREFVYPGDTKGEYSKEKYDQLVMKREEIKDATNRALNNVKELYKGAWSDAMVGLVHIKAMRVFVESVLRYGMPPSFAAFTCAPTGGHPKARAALANLLSKSDSNDKAFAGGDDGEEYFPYVSYTFTPFAVPREK